MKHSLHCASEDIPEGTTKPWRLTSGKVGRCARDMVGECQRCGTVVCRVCPAYLHEMDMYMLMKSVPRTAPSNLHPHPPCAPDTAASAAHVPKPHCSCSLPTAANAPIQTTPYPPRRHPMQPPFFSKTPPVHSQPRHSNARPVVAIPWSGSAKPAASI